MTEDYGNDYGMLHWDAHEARVSAFSTARRANKTVVKIELEVTGPWALGDIVRQLQEASLPPKPKPKAKPEPRTEAIAAPPLALPAPRLQLTDRRAS